MEGFLKYRKTMIERELKIGGRNMSHRMTGHSLAIALEIISAALKSPGQEICIIDHYPYTNQMNDHLAGMIQDRIDDMKLEGFKIIRKPSKELYLTFSLEYNEAGNPTKA